MLYIDDNVKYKAYDTDIEFLNKYSKDLFIFDLQTLEKPFLFYTTKKWSTKNNNYVKSKNKYFIIEPGYYYYITPETELFLNNNCKIKYHKK